MLVSRRLFGIKAVLLFAPLALYIVFSVLHFENLSNLASMTGAYAAAGILLLAYKKRNRSHAVSQSFILLALACFAWAIAETVWAIISFNGGNAEDCAALIVIYVLTNCLLLACIVFFSYTNSIKWDFTQLLVDVFFNSFLSIMLFWLLFFHKDITLLANFLQNDLTSVISILIDIFIGISIYSWFSSVRSGKKPPFLIIISIGLLLFSYTDIFYYYKSFHGLYYPNQLNDILYILSLSIIAFGALWRIYLDKTEYVYHDLVNSGRRVKWYSLLIYPIFTIGLIKFGFVSTKLALNDYILLFLPVVLYGASCGYIQKSILMEKTLSASLSESERSKLTLLNNLPGMAYRCSFNRQRTVQFVSDASLELTGYAPERFYNADVTFNSITAPEYRESIWTKWVHATENKKPFRYEYEIITADSKRKWVLEIGEGVNDEKGDAAAIEGIIFDISDRKAIEDHLRYIGEHDVSTGLYNIFYLDSLLEKDYQKKDGIKRALISINLSMHQQLMLNRGLKYSDALTVKIAEMLRQYCNDKRILFKTGERRFILYLRDYTDRNELIELSKTIACTLSASFVTDRISGGIGIVEIEQDLDEFDIDEIRRKTITATERSTDIIDKNFEACIYDEELELLVNREIGIRYALSAIAAEPVGDGLFLQYQPILDLKTESICGFEALARLKTVEFGPVTPGEFIPIAEETKLINPIGEMVILRALDFLKRLKEKGFETLSIAVNISVIQLLTPGFTDRLLEMIHEKQINPKNIAIEVTESVYVYDLASINSVLGALRDAGLHVALDDFGTGYSSLSRERDLSMDSIKIDKYFIDKLLCIDPREALTGIIIYMAHRLGHYVVAEGVEHILQLRYLIDHGCDRIQGYLISKPLDEDAALKFLNEFNYGSIAD